MLASKLSQRDRFDILRIQLIMNVVNRISKTGKNIFRLFAKDSYLCGLRAQCFLTVFNFFLQKNRSSSDYACIAFVRHKCPVNLESMSLLPNEVYDDVYFNDFNFVEGTHALIVCSFSGRLWTVDPTIGFVFKGGIEKMKEDIVPISTYSLCESHDVQNQPQPIVNAYYWFYKTQFFYKSISFISYTSILDKYCNKWVQLRLNFRLY